jgi:hypothetical protein
LEELLPKDNETMHLSLDGPVMRTEPQGFTADQMIRCDQCLRANPPTRISCLYCDGALPITESSAQLRRPTLRQPEKHELGFNCIFVPGTVPVQQESIESAANLLKLAPEDLRRIVGSSLPLPLARAISNEEIQLLFERLASLSVQTLTLSDHDLGIREESIVRPRSLEFESEHLVVQQSGGKGGVEVAWSDLALTVSGRLVFKKTEVKERVSRRAENELLETNQYFADEAVFDLYSSSNDQSWRIGANSFDFSCLEHQKTLVAGENLKKLHALIIAKVDTLCEDDSYNDVKTLLELVWPCEQVSQSHGLRREWLGKYSLGASTVSTNEMQFTRYSRLRRYFALNRSN